MAVCRANFLHKSSSATLLELATGGSLPEFAPQKRGPIKGTELLKVISTDLKDLLGGPSKSPNERYGPSQHQRTICSVQLEYLPTSFDVS